MTQSSIEWLAEAYNYVTWMRNRDEISAEVADEWRKRYLEQAQAMHKIEIENSYWAGYDEGFYKNDESFNSDKVKYFHASDYYIKNFGKCLFFRQHR